MRKQWKLSPYVLARLGGASQRPINELRFKRSVKHVQRIWSLRNWLRNNKERICNEELYKQIGSSSGRIKSCLVGIRRQLYKDRIPREKELGVIDELTSEPATIAIREYCEALRAYRDLLHGDAAVEAQQDFLSEMVERRVTLVEMMSNQEFIKGLQTASPSLASNVMKLISKDPRAWKKKERQTELRAIRYLTRMILKTSPFGRFGPVTNGRYDPGYSGVVESRFDGCHPVTKSSLNLTFVDRLIEDLWHVPSVRKDLPIYLNPSYFLDESDLCFYQPYGKGGIPKYTMLRRGKLIPEIEGVLSVAEAQSGKLNTKEFVAALRAAEFGVGWSDVKLEKFLESLINSGLLIRKLPVSTCQLDRISELLRTIDDWNISVPADWRRQMESLREHGMGFAAKSVISRRKAIKTSTATVNSLMDEEVNPKMRIASDRRLFVEDSYLEGAQIRLGTGFWERISEELSVFLDAIFARDNGGLGHQMLKDVFLGLYGQGGCCQDLARFANELSKAFFSNDLVESTGHENASKTNENGLKYIQEMINAVQNSGDVVEEQHLEPAFFERLTDHFGGEAAVRRSIALHLQVCAKSREDLERGEFSVVLNYTLPGHGRFFTRYCELFPEGKARELQSEISEQICAIEQDRPAAEVCEVISIVNHNAQVHPPLTERVIVMPGEESGLGANREIPLSELELRHERQTNSLHFYHGSTEIIPLYMGFFHAMALPYNHRVFVDGTEYSYHAERNRVADFQENLMPFVGSREDRRRVRHYSRVRCNKLVLQRETWCVDADRLPESIRAPKTDFDLFIHFNLWRLEHELPARCFVRIKLKKDSPSDIYQNLSPNEHKPMFIDFENFITIRSLAASIHSSRVQSLQFEEMLPDLFETPIAIGDEPITMELQVELNREAEHV